MKTKLLILLLFCWFQLPAPNLPITGLCWSDVFTATGTSCSPDAWTAANPAYFDATYAVSGDCLDDWRNYGPPAATTPIVTTTAITAITETTATGGGNVTSDGGASVTARGVCCNTSINPTIANSHTTDGSGTGSFVSYMTSLTADVYYYVRAYATNSAGTAYGSNVNFTATCTTRPSGLTDIILVYFTEGVTITSANVCYYAAHATDPYGSGSHANWNGTYGTDVFNGTGTDCTKYTDGYYLIDGPAPRAGVQVSGGKLFSYCPE